MLKCLVLWLYTFYYSNCRNEKCINLISSTADLHNYMTFIVDFLLWVYGCLIKKIPQSIFCVYYQFATSRNLIVLWLSISIFLLGKLGFLWMLNWKQFPLLCQLHINKKHCLTNVKTCSGLGQHLKMKNIFFYYFDHFHCAKWPFPWISGAIFAAFLKTSAAALHWDIF